MEFGRNFITVQVAITVGHPFSRFYIAHSHKHTHTHIHTHTQTHKMSWPIKQTDRFE